MASRSRFQSRMVSAIGISLALVAIAELNTPSSSIPPNSLQSPRSAVEALPFYFIDSNS